MIHEPFIIIVGGTSASNHARRIAERYNRQDNKRVHLLYVTYGSSVAGYRPDVVIIAAPPRTFRDEQWLYDQMQLRCRPDTPWIEAY